MGGQREAQKRQPVNLDIAAAGVPVLDGAADGGQQRAKVVGQRSWGDSKKLDQQGETTLARAHRLFAQLPVYGANQFWHLQKTSSNIQQMCETLQNRT